MTKKKAFNDEDKHFFGDHNQMLSFIAFRLKIIVHFNDTNTNYEIAIIYITKENIVPTSVQSLSCNRSGNLNAGNTKGGSITVLLTSCLTGLD